MELVKEKFISDENHSLLFKFDDLFQNKLEKGYTIQELFSAIHYIVPRVIEKDFKDEDGRKIENLYGYFKNALESNFEKLNNIGEEQLFENDCSILLYKSDDRSVR